MNIVLQPWHLLVLILANWLNRQQQAVVDYMLTENKVLRELQGKRRILLSDDQRRRLAIKGGDQHVIGKHRGAELGSTCHIELTTTSQPGKGSSESFCVFFRFSDFAVDSLNR